MAYDKHNKSNDNSSFDLNSYSSSAMKAEKKGRRRKDTNKGAKSPLKARIAKVLISAFLVCVITGCLVAGAVLVYAFGFVDASMDDVDLDNLELNFTTIIYAEDRRTGEFVEYQRLHGTDNRIWIDDENGNIPENLKNAFIAVEDKTFETHKGVNWKRTFSAFFNLFFKYYSSNQGGSTITQQLVKNLTGDNSSSPARKVREIMRARELEEEYSKDTILECYVNTVAMGGGICGVEVASNYYFDKSAKDLTLNECAALAAIVKAPETYRPDTESGYEANKERRQTVLALMLEQGLITQAEFDKAFDEELIVVANKGNLNEVAINSYFVDALIDEVAQDLMDEYGYDENRAYNKFYTSGYKIYATVDPTVQNALDIVFADETYHITNKDGDVLQGAMTVMDYEGHIVGMAGGLGEKTANRGFNRATSAVRQPGSTMKPISAYAQAIERDLITYSSIVKDEKREYGRDKWTPNNWYRDKYRGNMTIEYALEISANTIPVMLVDQLTPQRSYDFLTQKLGITTLTAEDINYSPLGMGGTNGGLTTLEEAAAYATFGNGGVYYEPITYYKVTDQDDQIVLRNESATNIAFSEDTATVMNHLLQNVVYGSQGTANGMGSTVSNMKIFAKTGTSNENMNSWFTGGTPYYIGSTWCGFEEYKPLSDSQAYTSKKLWRAVMSMAHGGLEAKQFVDSPNAVSKQYCTSSGLLATPNCTSTDTGWYKKSNVPSMCTQHPEAPSAESETE